MRIVRAIVYWLAVAILYSAVAYSIYWINEKNNRYPRFYKRSGRAEARPKENSAKIKGGQARRRSRKAAAAEVTPREATSRRSRSGTSRSAM